MDNTLVSWEEIPAPLKNHFIIRWILGAAVTVIASITAIYTGLHKAFGGLAVCSLFYEIYIFYLFWSTRHCKMSVFEGICESVKKEKLNIPNPIPLIKSPLASIYGKSQITIVINEDKFVIPVSQRFDVEEGNSVQVYTLNTDIYELGENAYVINSPIVVWRSKI